jgi:hypothetical protein
MPYGLSRGPNVIESNLETTVARRLEDRLAEFGVEMDADSFRTLLTDTLNGMYRNWNDEELMHRPSEALRYCHAIRQASRGYDLPEEVILRALSGQRKHP